jgi:Flp pilus assembly pilin Flp
VPRVQLLFGRLTLRALELRRAAARQEGQALIEYALIISLIAVVAIGVLQTTGVNIRTLLNRTASDV